MLRLMCACQKYLHLTVQLKNPPSPLCPAARATTVQLCQHFNHIQTSSTRAALNTTFFIHLLNYNVTPLTLSPNALSVACSLPNSEGELAQPLPSSGHTQFPASLWGRKRVVCLET